MKLNIERYYPLIVFLFSFIIYANTISNAYNLDDELVTINHRTSSKGIAGIPEILNSYYYEDEMGYKYDYRPVTHISFAIEHQFFGENASVSHSVNVLLYAFLCLLIFFLSNRLLPDKSPLFGFIVALIFAVHPIHTEVVASIKNRDEILSLLFGLSAFYLLVIQKNTNYNFKNGILIIISIFLFVLGIYAKLSSIVLLLLIPIYFLLINKLNVYHLIFTFFGSLFASFSIINNLPIQFTAITLFTLFFIAAYYYNRNIEKSFIVLIKDNGTFISIFLLIVSYLVMILGVLKGSSFVIYIAVIFGFITFLINKNNNKLLNYLFIFLYPILLFFAQLYKVNWIVAYYFISFILLNKDEDWKSLIKYYVVFFIISAFSLDSLNHFLILGFIPFFFIFFKKYFKYSVLVWSILLLGLSSDTWILAVINFGFTVFIFVYFFIGKWNQKAIFQALKLLPLFVLFMILISNVAFNLKTYEGKDKFKIVETNNIEIAQIKKLNYFNKDTERPILLIENPIIENWEISSRVSLALQTNLFYLKKFIVPYPLSFYYGHKQIVLFSWLDYQTYIHLSIHILLFCLIFYFFWKKKYFIFWVLLFLIFSLIIYSNFLTPIAGIVGERLSFTASFAWALLVGVCFIKLSEYQYNVSYIFLGVCAIVFSFVTIHRNTLWKDKLTLFSHDIKHLGNSAQANALLADAYMVEAAKSSSSSRVDSLSSLAVLHFEKSIKIYDQYINWWVDLGRVYKIRADYDKSIFCFEKALSIDTSYTPIVEELQELVYLQKDYQKTIVYTNQLLQTYPNNLNYLLNLSAAYYFTNSFNEVIEVNNKIIALNSKIPEAYLNKAYAYTRLYMFDEAKKNVEFAKAIQPNHGDIPLVLSLIESLN